MKTVFCVLLISVLLLLASCSGSQTAYSCTTDSDCGVVFDSCTCSWVCKNKAAQLERSDDFECDVQCPSTTSVLPPACSCQPLGASTAPVGSSEVILECRVG